MKLDQFFFCDAEGTPILRDGAVVPIHVGGIVSGSAKHKEGECICTSTIVEEPRPNVVKTESGSEYELGEMDPDYAAMLKAKKDGIIIVYDWCLMEQEFNDEKTKTTFKRCLILGNIGDGIFGPIGFVLGLNGNFLTVERPSSPNGGEEMFVNWSAHTKRPLIGNFNYPDDFEKFCGRRSRPKKLETMKE